MILGHERQIQYLEKVLKKGRLAHAYLFYGPEGVGKFTIAKAFARTLQCASHQGQTLISRSDLDDCSCVPCRLIEQNAHPHVYILDPEHTLVSKKEKRKDIPIEDIRELKRLLSLAPEGGQWRIVIINEAEKLSFDAADAFLKLLEEPGAQTLIILVTSERELLLPTVVSRAIPIRFSLVPEHTLAETLRAEVKDPALQKEILLLAGGRPGAVFRLLKEGNLEKERKFLRQILVILKQKAITEALQFSEKTAFDEGGRKKMIEYIMRTLRARLLGQVGDTIPLVRKLKNIQRIAGILETTNVNPRLALDAMMLECLS